MTKVSVTEVCKGSPKAMELGALGDPCKGRTEYSNSAFRSKGIRHAAIQKSAKKMGV